MGTELFIAFLGQRNSGGRPVIRALVATVILTTLSGCDFLLYERQVITVGEFRGLAIGASKLNVLEGIRKLNVHSIRPVPAVDFRVTKANVEELEKARQVDGLRITGKPGMAMDIFFSDGKVSLVRTSVQANRLTGFTKICSEKLRLTRLRNCCRAIPSGKSCQSCCTRATAGR